MKKVIYCVIIRGNSDKRLILHEPTYISEGWDHVCFTDDATLASSRWDVRVIKTKGLSARRESRRPKMLNDEYLPEYDLSIYIDSRFKVTRDLNWFYEAFSCPGHNLVMTPAPRRTCLYKEARFCLIKKSGNAKQIRKQAGRYKSEGFPSNFGLTRGGFILRRHGIEKQKRFMKKWFSEIEHESERDMISFPYVMWKYPIPIYYLPTQKVYRFFTR